MKNLSLIFAFIALFSLGAQAQSISVGLRGGINLTTNVGEDVSEDNKFVTGANFAIPVEIGVSDNFSVQPELHYIQKGTKVEFSDDLYAYSLTNYFELPILAKGMFGTENIKGYVAAGPTLGVAFSRFVTLVNGDEKEREKAERDDQGEETDNIFDFGLTGAIGVEINAGPGAFVIDARYNMDLNDNTSFENDAPENYNPTKNSGIGISVGYVISLGK